MIKIHSNFDHADYLHSTSLLIEKTLKSFLVVRVAEVKIENDYDEYCCEVAVGTDLNEIEKHSRDLALALASPTGKVSMVIPIPGKALIGIHVPKPTKEYYEKIRKEDEAMRNMKHTWNEKISFSLFILARLIEILAAKFYRISNRK